MQEVSNMHEEAFARRVNFTRRDIFVRRKFCTKTLSHEGSNLHEDTFARVKLFLCFYWPLIFLTITLTLLSVVFFCFLLFLKFFCFLFFFITVTPNPYCRSVTFFLIHLFLFNFVVFLLFDLSYTLI